MDITREKIYLAALLHDIGKFYQRADTGSVAGSVFLKEHCKDESSFCPVHDGIYTHKHVLWTAQFIEDYASVFRRLADADVDNLTVKDNLMNLAAGHHLRNEQLSDLGRIIKEADSLSSGMDRDSQQAFNDCQDDVAWNSFKKKRMTSILQTILSEPDQIKQMLHLPVEKLTLTKQVFPQADFQEDPDYATLWKHFNDEFKYIQANTYHAFAETLLNLLLKYTSFVPASTIDFPDVSLYDHLKTTAAIAVCLYDWKKSSTDSITPFLLIGADFSGIQPYIYQIVSKYAGKNLKGRSFYLKILSDAIVRYLLNELNLYQANVVYNSGGGFYLIAPNTPFVKQQLDKAIHHIEEKLFEAHGTALYVAIDSVEMSKDTLLHSNNESLGKKWGELFNKRDRKKSTKFSTLMMSNHDAFFCPLEQGGDAERDSITGEEFLPGERKSILGDLTLKKVSLEQIKMGEKLRETNIIAVTDNGELPYWRDRLHIEPIGLGFTYYFLNNVHDLSEMKEQLRASADHITVITMNGAEGNCDFIHTIDGINNIYSLDFYGGNEVDRKNLPTFEEMCKKFDKGDESNGLSRLGVLRMDVDNLGNIFQQGIAPERATLSRFAALSRSFDFYFSGYLNTIWRETVPERSFIIYSGGDDLFIVGRWNVCIELAEKIRNDFKEYTCSNPFFTLSGGIAIITPKFPIMKGAEMSDDEEKNAKEHECKGHGKNSISFMEMPLNWDLEFPAVKALKNDIVDLIGSDALPKSFISKVIVHQQQANFTNHIINNLKSYWMLTYDLSRMKSRVSNIKVKTMIDNCIKEVCNKSCGTLNAQPITTGYHALELWALAARWAELEYRTL